MRTQRAAGYALVLVAACAHTTETSKNADVKDARSTQAGESTNGAGKGTPKTPPGHPPLAASPSELLQPGARQRVAQALRTKGFLDSDDAKGEQLGAGLRKFQESQGLAATGFPDHETLRRLGIDPKEVDKSFENFSGTEPGKAQADVSRPSDDAGKGGSAPTAQKAPRATTHRRPTRLRRTARRRGLIPATAEAEPSRLPGGAFPLPRCQTPRYAGAAGSVGSSEVSRR